MADISKIERKGILYNIKDATARNLLQQKYTVPIGGIPKEDLSLEVQNLLQAAKTAIQNYTETDPTVPAWAKAVNKPTYTAEEVGALPSTTHIPVDPVNADWNASSGLAQILNKPALFSGDYNDLINKPVIPVIPTNVSSFVNDAGYLTQHQDISGKANISDLATVATTGSYNDLTDKPDIPEEVDLSGYYDKTEVDGLLDDKVDKVSGKGLSTNDYTTAEKTKLAGIEAGAKNSTMIVKVNSINQGLEADHTFAEIAAAIEDGKNVVVINTGDEKVYQLSYIDPSEVYFTSCQGDEGTFSCLYFDELGVEFAGEASIPSIDNTLSNSSTSPVQNKVITAALAGKANAADLADVATSGSYNDLSDTPDVPIAISVNEQSFVMNQFHAFVIPDYYTKTQIDNAGYVTSSDVADAVADLVDSAPDTLDTLNELAAALGDDPNFATTISTALGNKVDKETGKGLFSGSYNDLTNKPSLFSGNYNDLTNKPTIPAAQVNADWNASSGVSAILNKPTIPSAQVNADWNASSGVMEILNKPTIPTKFSDLVDDSDYITAQDVASIVVGSADVVITETASHICITFVTTSISFTPNTTMSLWAGQKVGTLTVSGTHLKQDITLTVPSNFTAQVSGGTAAQSITIPQTGGEVTGMSVTITYTGADSGSYNGSITATSGSTTASVGLVYSQYQGATIIAGTIGTIKAAMGSSQIGELNVSGVNLEGDITASVGSGDFTICATQNGTYGTTETISKASAEASGGATLFVKYTPSSGTSTASGTLTLTTPKDGSTTTESVSLQGAVSTLTLSTNSVSISTDQGVAATGTFTINGSNLTNGVTLALTDANSVFSLSKNSLTKAEAEAGETITVTYNSSNVGSHSGSISVVWDGGTETITLSGSAAEVPNFNDANSHKLEVGGICYGVIDDGNGGWTNNLAVYNRDFSTSAPTKRYTGEVIIPSTVNAQLDGVPTTFTVTTIKAHAFNSNTGMTKLVIPDTVTSAGNAFLYLASGNLKYLSFGNGLKNSTSETTIPTSSGSSPTVRTGLTYLDLGTGIQRITGMEFRMAVGGTVVLRSDSVVGASPTRLNSNSNNNYAPAIVDGIVKVPSSLVPSYQGATGWSDQNPDSNGRYMVEYDNILAIE